MKSEKFEKIAREALLNAAALFRDAAILFKSGSFSSATYLSILAIEELGKFIAIDNYVFHDRVDGKRTEKEALEFLGYTYNHKWKQAGFSRNHFGSIRSKIYSAFVNGEMEEEKQKCIYVGVARGKYKGKVFLPKEKGRNRAEEILSFAHYLILDQFKDITSGSYDSSIRGFKPVVVRNIYKDMFYMWDVNYKAHVKKRDWEYIREGFNHVNAKMGIRHVD